MHLVVNKVMELKIVDVAAEYLVYEWHTCSSIVEGDLAVLWKASLNHLLLNLLHSCRLEHRSLVPDIILDCSPSKLCLHQLSDVHTGRNAKWVETYIKWCTVFHVWHIFLRKDS